MWKIEGCLWLHSLHWTLTVHFEVYYMRKRCWESNRLLLMNIYLGGHVLFCFVLGVTCIYSVFRFIFPYRPFQSIESSSSCLQCRRPVFNPWLGRVSGEENGNPLQYYCLENSMDREAWWATFHGVTESDMTEQLTHTMCICQC